MAENKKASMALDDLLSRQDYLVTQANDLAKAFGNLSAFEHKVLDYCFSFVTKDSKTSDTYKVDSLDIVHHFGLTKSGRNYERIAQAFKTLNEHTALYFAIEENGKRGVLMTQLFGHIKFLEDGEVSFKFSEDAAPYVFALKRNYYSFRLGDLARVKSKYTLVLLKLWQANMMGVDQPHVTIEGTLDDWEGWLLGDDRRWPAGRFKRDTLDVALDELEAKFGVSVIVTVQKRGVKVVGYSVDITSTRALVN